MAVDLKGVAEAALTGLPLPGRSRPKALGQVVKALQGVVDSTLATSPPRRTRLPVERKSVDRDFRLPWPNGEILEVHATVGLYEDGQPGEIFIRAGKMGGISSGALDMAACAISVGLQYGIPLSVFTDKLIGQKFEPAGPTGDKEFPIAQSVWDVVGRWLRARFEMAGETK